MRHASRTCYCEIICTFIQKNVELKRIKLNLRQYTHAQHSSSKNTHKIVIVTKNGEFIEFSDYPWTLNFMNNSCKKNFVGGIEPSSKGSKNILYFNSLRNTLYFHF